MKKLTFIAAVLFTIISCDNEDVDNVTSQSIIFTWDNSPFDDGLGTVTETVDNITVTVTSPQSTHKHSVGYMDIIDADGNSKDNVVVSYHPESSITFTFSQPVSVTSIVAMSGDNQNITYTFLPLEAGNDPIVKNLIPGKNVAAAFVDFNWTLITSFTVTSSDTLFGFDYLIVSVPNATL